MTTPWAREQTGRSHIVRTPHDPAEGLWVIIAASSRGMAPNPPRTTKGLGIDPARWVEWQAGDTPPGAVPGPLTPRIARPGVESKERLGRYRWVVERTLAWKNQLRGLGSATSAGTMSTSASSSSAAASCSYAGSTLTFFRCCKTEDESGLHLSTTRSTTPPPSESPHHPSSQNITRNQPLAIRPNKSLDRDTVISPMNLESSPLAGWRSTGGLSLLLRVCRVAREARG
ncbi:hypothetical protein COSO111634_01570 [Corallococcus soli]